MSKQSSKAYYDQCKENYLNNAISKPNKDCLLFGFAENNIGHAIFQELLNCKHSISALTEDEFTVGNDQMYMIDGIHNCDVAIFNNAKMNLDWIGEQDHQKIESVIFNTMTATIKAVNDFVRLTMDNGKIKTIIIIGSMAHNHVLNASSAYCAAKAGIAMYARCAAYELAPKGYRVYCIHPSNVLDAPMSEQTITELMRLRSLTREQAESYWAAECPMGTFLTKKEIAETVAYLLTDSARYLSGSDIELKGGQR